MLVEARQEHQQRCMAADATVARHRQHESWHVLLLRMYDLDGIVCRHGKNINSDMWRQMQLWRGAGNPAHPFSRFHTGNHETLMSKPKVQHTSVVVIMSLAVWKLCWRHQTPASLLLAQGCADLADHESKVVAVINLQEKNITVHEEVRKFWERHYSANVMRAALVSRHSLDELEAFARAAFAPIVNQQLTAPVFSGNSECTCSTHRHQVGTGDLL